MIRFHHTLMCGLLFVFAMSFGCGSEEQGYEEPTKAVVVSPSQSVKTWLDGVAQSDQLDSGSMVLLDQIDQMKAAGAANADELKQDAEELLKLKNPAKIKSKAKEMVEKIEVIAAPPADA